jgi:hypothetical protein
MASVKDKLKEVQDKLNLFMGKETEIINLAQIAEVNKWYIEVENDTFAVGNKVIRKWWDNETEPLGAGEYELENGAKMMVDSSGIITTLEGGNLIFNKNNTMDEKIKELEAQLSEQKESSDKVALELTAANEKVVELSEKIALSEEDVITKPEKVIQKVVEDPNKVVLEKVAELEAKIVELEKQPVVEVELEDKELSFAELQNRRDNQFNEKNKD